MTLDLQAIADNGVAALRRGDARTARDAFDRLDKAGRGSHQLRLLLAQACFLLDDRDHAHRALDRVLAEEPANLYALIMRGDLIARAGDPRAAVSWYQAALTQAPRAGPLPQDLIVALDRVQRAVGQIGTAFQGHLDQQLKDLGIAPDDVGPRFTEALDILSGRAEVQLQQPTNFYYPGLAQRPFFEREEFEWVSALEEAAPSIRAELQDVLAREDALTPYVAAEPDRPSKKHPLIGDIRWSAFHLIVQGRPVTANADLCPVTLTTLERLPLARIDGHSPMALFSVLRPGTHIPPHHGMLNTRLICHLPLIVPPGCRLRVGNRTRPVEQDRVMIFDDSIEHEAWNDGNATRVVLLFEIWRPDLTAREQAGISALFRSIGLYSSPAVDQAGA
ncbi:aspartyl/asparaginyl beta-hydroxylase domain-containing protein [uncultured Sphingomonas sp.]|uniref:aspartyl/asparaginyl beta-hydroxylase domain-containing protein n=1 Tax=uncultured Sphingomonas sp. TaxID=158754 RepID=UPI0025D26474|nr:aspartyl/asparaginyl beta-hydroxylase domain-containing protein [uncultured Sphingomonas sp.]